MHVAAQEVGVQRVPTFKTVQLEGLRQLLPGALHGSVMGWSESTTISTGDRVHVLHGFAPSASKPPSPPPEAHLCKVHEYAAIKKNRLLTQARLRADIRQAKAVQ